MKTQGHNIRIITIDEEGGDREKERVCVFGDVVFSFIYLIILCWGCLHQPAPLLQLVFTLMLLFILIFLQVFLFYFLLFYSR